MQGRVVRAFDGAPDGEIYPRHFNPGDTVSGNLAVVALREGWAITSPAGPVTVPEGWADLRAADLVKLARELGAPAEVATKAGAAAFVQAEIDRGAAAAPAGRVDR